MKKAIYVYTDGSCYKIGKADQRLDQSSNISIEEICDCRINEQQTAATYGELKLIYPFDISSADSSVMVESYIHKKLVEKGYDRLKRKYKGKEGKTEWFDLVDLDDSGVIELVGNLIKDVTGLTGKFQYQPRAYQAYVKAMLLDKVVSGDKVVACELAPRFGKTLWSLDLFNTLCFDMEYQYMILPSYILTAHSSFFKERNKCSDFEDTLFISDNDDDFENKVRLNKDKRLIIAVSLHTPEDNFKKYECIKELSPNKKVAFVDEADFGAHTDKSKKVIDLLECDLKILMTGTAIERVVAGYNVESVIVWSYTDMLLLKDNRHPMLNYLVEE